MDVFGTVALGAVFVLTVAVALRHRPVPVPGPRLSPDLAETILARAGFPTTAHNVVAVREHLGALFLEQGRVDVDPARWADVVAASDAARDGGAGDDAAGWPQYVLDQIAAAGDAGAAAAGRLARSCQEALLASVGTGRGIFGGSLFEPLPRPGTPVA